MPTVGVDLGGTKILGVLVDGGRIIGKAKASTPRVGTAADVLDAVAQVVRRVDPEGSAGLVGVGVPGPVRPGTGVLPVASNLPGWDHDVDVADGLRRRCGEVGVVVVNDVNAATYAEARHGAAVGHDNVMGVYMGTGVGAALVLDGTLRHGPRGLAGEIGHTYVAFRDFHHGGVGRGELEDYAGRRMMERRARSRHTAGDATALVDLAGEGRMKSSTWEQALEASDPVALEMVDDATEAMASAIAGAIALVDLELVVLGGGMAERLGEPFRADLETRITARTFAGGVAPVRAAALGDVGGALGAALLAEHQLAEEPSDGAAPPRARR